jgi:hypothetical protein
MRTRIITILTMLLALSVQARSQQRTDTLRVSDLFTTHIIFNTDLIYADLSNSQACAAKILEQSKNMMALKARSPFTTPLSVSALESNGAMHTYIVVFDENPDSLVYDMRQDRRPTPDSGDGGAIKESKKKKGETDVAGLYRRFDAPLLQDVVAAPQSLWHISTRQYSIEVTCTTTMSYSDITYMVFSIRNSSGVSYECPDATFVVESKKRSKRGVVYDRNIFPKSRYGTASCAPKQETRIGYSLDKVSLAKDQVLRVYFYEEGGQRELVLTIDARDINHAKTSL